MGEDQPFELLATVRNRVELSAQLGSMAAQGSVVLADNNGLPKEILAIDSDGSATYARQHERSYVSMDVDEGLAVVGVMRKLKHLHRRELVTCSAVDIQVGDSVVLQGLGDEQFTTRRMRRDWGAATRKHATKVLQRAA